ncbi:MAG: Isoprenylcysteine carboxyl methyltransferase (ICMT) family protein [Candidatus Cloacimonetes bacterium ADurb.Bin088]|jgi:protein-S-isoprenylcysteine O-methyltransferase Ste14|nr:MAG: Isoprenylcysteine carboxyl methyltransferase (ICMT) family protein [Candidatus Cloacimonetes bacterium ADurb.Bin088]
MKAILEWAAKKRLTLMRILVPLILVALVVFDHKPLPLLRDWFNAAHLGMFVVLAGLLLRSWAAGMIHKNTILTTTGPYALSRHPLYLGSLLLALGFALIVNSWPLWIVLGAMLLLAYVPKIRQEEVKLQRLFGDDWLAYKRDVAVFFPKKLRWGKLWKKWSLTVWWRHREFNAWLASLAGLALLAWWGK